MPSLDYQTPSHHYLYETKILAKPGKPIVLADGSHSKFVWSGSHDSGTLIEVGNSVRRYWYVMSSEQNNSIEVIVFSTIFTVMDAYQIYNQKNHGGIPTPWNTFLIVSDHHIWETFPLEKYKSPIQYVSMGRNNYQHLCVDYSTGVIYLADDHYVYRFIPHSSIRWNGYKKPDLRKGELQVLRVSGHIIRWTTANPNSFWLRLLRVKSFPQIDAIEMCSEKQKLLLKVQNNIVVIDIIKLSYHELEEQTIYLKYNKTTEITVNRCESIPENASGCNSSNRKFINTNGTVHLTKHCEESDFMITAINMPQTVVLHSRSKLYQPITQFTNKNTLLLNFGQKLYLIKLRRSR